MNFEINDFDSEILGYTVGRIALSEAGSYKDFDKTKFDNFIAVNNVKFVIGSSIYSPQNINLLDQLGFKFISTKTVYKLYQQPTTYAQIPAGYTIENYKQPQSVPLTLSMSKGLIERENEQALTEMMVALANTSHYSKNVNLPQNTATQIYTKWFENIFKDNRADKIFIAKYQNTVIGFVSLYKNNNQYFIDLIATHPEHRGKGIASLLTQKAIKYATSLNKQLYVITQAENIVANRLYQKNGFIIETFQLIYHKII